MTDKCQHESVRMKPVISVRGGC